MSGLDVLKSFDEELFLFFNGLHAEWLDMPMYILTKAWAWIPVFAWMAVKIWQRGASARNFGVLLLGMGLTVAAADLTSYRLLKQQIKRYRPTHHLVIGPNVHTVTDFKGNEYRGGQYGFVSSHATNFFGIATFMFIILYRKSRYAWLFIWAGFISYTRLYLGVHYPADLVGGAILGMFLGWLIATVSQRFVQTTAQVNKL
ncbi:MAG: phosphatase PAP2 family protein [Flavobacteriales bacterium]